MLPVTSSKPLREPRVGLIFYTGLLWSKSNRSFLDSLLPVCLLGKFHWFTHLGQSYFYGPSAFMNCWISNFMKKVVLERERWQLSEFHLLPPTLSILLYGGRIWIWYFLPILGLQLYPITNTVVLQEFYCGTITEPGSPVVKNNN